MRVRPPRFFRRSTHSGARHDEQPRQSKPPRSQESMRPLLHAACGSGKDIALDGETAGSDRRGRRAGRRSGDEGPQRLQLVGLHRPGGHRGLREGNRHQGQLRRLRLERGARDQAADRQLGLRRRRAERLLPRAADQGGRLPQARPGAAAEPREPRPRRSARAARHDPGNEHSVIYMWGTTGIGYDAGQGRGDHAGRAPRQLAA